MIAFGSAAPARADATDKKLADQKFIEGRDFLKAGKFEDACKKFHEANKFDEKAVVILLNLGLCYEKQNKVAAKCAELVSNSASHPANCCAGSLVR